MKTLLWLILLTTTGFCATAATYTVLNTNDSGSNSLRQAILDANSHPGMDTIGFSITGSVVHTISPATALPTITDPVIIDGYTQPGSGSNYLTVGDSAQLKIELSGSMLTNGVGLSISSGGCTVRGLVINRFTVGISIFSGGTNVIRGNFIGTDPSGSLVRTNGQYGVIVSSSANIIGGTLSPDRNLISGNSNWGLEVAGGNTNQIYGNYIGIDATGTNALPNGAGIVVIAPATNTVIGNAFVATGRNVISGNGTGVGLSANSSLVQGNIIGLDANGAVALGNIFSGVQVNGNFNTIGGTNAGSRNLISGNGDVGVEIIGDGATNNWVLGNYIGPDSTGAQGPGNFNGGLYVQAAYNTIGGSSPGAGNVISGNDYIGLNLDGGSCCGNNAVQGNYIGTTADGLSPLANAGAGIEINCHGNLIGGTVPGAGNVISANATNGIDVMNNAGNVIQGNFIGTNPGGATNLGNFGAGILILDSLNNTVGGTISGAGNTIAYNAGVGVALANSVLCRSNAILGNLIFQNAALSIDLNWDGFTPNDVGDIDAGPNNLQNFPILTSATAAGSTSVRGTLNSIAGRSYRLEFFGSPTFRGTNLGDARTFLGTINATTDGGGNANFTALLPVAVAPGYFVCATATDPLSNTSELSPPVPASLAFGIGSLSAARGAAGSTLTIYGTNFSVIAEENIVYFGAVRATVVSASPTNLVVLVPPGASYGPVSVTLAGLTAYSQTPFVPTFPTAHSISFAPKFNLPPGASQVGMAVGDLDGDGRPDLVVVVGQNNTTNGYIYRNIEPGGNLTTSPFAPPIALSGSGRPTAVALADLDGDGSLDVIVLTTSPDQLEVFRNISFPGGTAFQAPLSWPALGGGLGALAIADIDGDGLPDVIATGMTNNQVAIFRNLGSQNSISLAAHVDFAAGTAPVALAVTDLDGDGKPDIVASDANISAGGTFSVLRNLSTPGTLGTNSFANRFSLTNNLTGSHGIVAADFDGDGKADLAVALTSSNRVAVYRNISVPGTLNSSSFALPVNLAFAGWPRGLAVADLDGDGKLELICANTNSTAISVFWNVSTPGSLTNSSFSPRLDLPVGSSSFAVAAADFDLDGKPDLIALGNTPDRIILLRNQANEPFFLINTLPPPGNTVVVTNSADVQIFNRFTNGPIYYTLDGSPPDTTSARYSNSFNLTQSITLRAIAFYSNTLLFAEAPALNLIVVRPPFITLQPQSVVADTGDDVLFAGSASGSPPLSFQWTKNGVNIPGGTDPALFLTNISLPQAATYSMTVSNAYGIISSSNAVLVIRTAPTITAQPGNTDTGVGASVTFTTTVSGAPPITYQWRRNGANIAGATNSSITITNLQLTDGATYTVVVSSAGGTVIAGPAQLIIVSVASQAGGDNFASASVLAGGSGSISGTNTFATREFGEPLHAGKPGTNSVWYSWMPTNTGIATFSTIGSTFDTLLAVYTGTLVTNLITIASDDDSGGSLASKLSFNATSGTTYRIAVDGFNGAKGRFLLNWSLEKTNATIPVITCHPANQTVLKGGVASFTVSVTGSNLTYQWLFDGTNIVGASNSFYVRTNVQVQHVGFYGVRVTGAGNRAVDSLPAILEIGPFSDVQSKDKPDDVFPVCAGSLTGFSSRAQANSAGASSVAMGSIGSQYLVGVSTNNVADCNTTNCGGIPRGTRYFELTPTVNANFALDTSGSVSHTRMWVCAKGTNNLDPTRTFLKCDEDGAPDGRSLIRFDALGGRTYQAWIAKLDNTNEAIQLNWRLGLPPVLYNVAPDQFLAEGTALTLGAMTTNIISTDATTPLAAPTLTWYFNGAYFGSGSLVTIPKVTMANAGQYTVVASNAIGNTSAIVHVEVYGQASSSVLSSGGSIELFADDSTAACPTAPTYQWNLDGQPIIGQTGRSLILRNVQASQAGAYSVTVHNCFGSTTYNASTLAVTVDVGFVAQLTPPNLVILIWRATPGKHYRVQYRTNLGSPIWTTLGPDLTTTSTGLSVSDQVTSVPRFYRIVLLD